MNLSKEIHDNENLKKTLETNELKLDELNKLIERKNAELKEKEDLFEKVFEFLI